MAGRNGAAVADVRIPAPVIASAEPSNAQTFVKWLRSWASVMAAKLLSFLAGPVR